MVLLTDTWFNPNRECWELQRTGGVELTFRNTVISTPTWLSLWRSYTYRKWRCFCIWQHCNLINCLQNLWENLFLPVLVMGTRTFIPFFCLLGFCCEWGLLLLYNLSKVEHSMKPEVHHLNGCEKYGHHSRVQACYHQARRKSLRRSEKTMTVTVTNIQNWNNAVHFKEWVPGSIW